MAKKIVKNSNELKAAMGKLLQTKLEEIKNMVQETIREFLELWYEDYTPSLYPRSFQLLNSCVSIELTKSGNTYRAQIYIDYSNMHHMSYWKNSRPPKENRNLTQDEELKIVRLADGRNENATSHIGNRDNVQRGLKHPPENVVIGTGKHGVRFWTDAIDMLSGRENMVPYNTHGAGKVSIFDAFEEYLRKKGFTVTRKSPSADYFMPLLY